MSEKTPKNPKTPPPARIIPRLLTKYRTQIVPEMQKKFNVKNPLAIPRLEKIVINMGVGAAIADIKLMDVAVQDLATITGQKPIIRRAKKAISNFKLKEKMPIGCKVTLRRDRMYEFVDRLFNVCLPRIRDFNGTSRKAFDRFGNYSLGIQDQSIFPEVDTGRISRVQGMDITFVFNKGPQELTFELLSLLGMPFAKLRKGE